MPFFFVTKPWKQAQPNEKGHKYEDPEDFSRIIVCMPYLILDNIYCFFFENRFPYFTEKANQSQRHRLPDDQAHLQAHKVNLSHCSLVHYSSSSSPAHYHRRP
jgi:hypothetical protein